MHELKENLLGTLHKHLKDENEIMWLDYFDFFYEKLLKLYDA